MPATDAPVDEIAVRIEVLPPMRVARARGFGLEPERQAWEKLIAWAESQGLSPLTGEHRFFGFDDPAPGQPGEEYGYQQWMTIEEGVQAAPADEVETLDAPGGRFAVIHCANIANITRLWHRLAAWVEESEHEYRYATELEELLTPTATDLDEYAFDLYLPITDE